MTDAVDELTIDELRKSLSFYESTYKQLRETLYRMISQYYRQDVLSNYVKESDISDKLLECQKCKETYRKIRNLLLDAGQKGLDEARHPIERFGNQPFSFKDI